ncbi:uncharacterized protein LOC121386495 [Gigantopelta aegis]|uniref:uncharacterized protein LOC121386495 n=1 Tax=Gigantopelta aegis TaxID=1735272 RepID=UPI001B888367|nr:uncharacterized protein LOC121386495 [Gigantopelta aegis]
MRSRFCYDLTPLSLRCHYVLLRLDHARAPPINTASSTSSSGDQSSCAATIRSIISHITMPKAKGSKVPVQRGRGRGRGSTRSCSQPEPPPTPESETPSRSASPAASTQSDLPDQPSCKSSPASSRSPSPKAKKVKKMTNLSTDEEESMAEWLAENQLLYNKKLFSYKNKAKKDKMWADKATEMGKTVETLQIWYRSIRTRYGRLLKKKQRSQSVIVGFWPSSTS